MTGEEIGMRVTMIVASSLVLIPLAAWVVLSHPKLVIAVMSVVGLILIREGLSK